MAQKKYIGSGKVHEFADGGQVVNGIIYLDFDEEDVHTGKTGRQFIKISVCERSEIDEYGNSHYIIIDDFKPNKSATGKSKKKATKKATKRRITTRPPRARAGTTPF